MSKRIMQLKFGTDGKFESKLPHSDFTLEQSEDAMCHMVLAINQQLHAVGSHLQVQPIDKWTKTPMEIKRVKKESIQ